MKGKAKRTMIAARDGQKFVIHEAGKTYELSKERIRKYGHFYELQKAKKGEKKPDVRTREL